MPLSSLAANLSMRMSSLTHDWTSTKHADEVKVVQMEKGWENEAKEQVVSRTLKRKFDVDGAEEKCCSYQVENAYGFDKVGVTKVQGVQSSPSPSTAPSPPPVQQPARKKCRHRGNSKFIRSLLCLLRKEKDERVSPFQRAARFLLMPAQAERESIMPSFTPAACMPSKYVCV